MPDSEESGTLLRCLSLRWPDSESSGYVTGVSLSCPTRRVRLRIGCCRSCPTSESQAYVLVVVFSWPTRRVRLRIGCGSSLPDRRVRLRIDCLSLFSPVGSQATYWLICRSPLHGKFGEWGQFAARLRLSVSYSLIKQPHLLESNVADSYGDEKGSGRSIDRGVDVLRLSKGLNSDSREIHSRPPRRTVRPIGCSGRAFQQAVPDRVERGIVLYFPGVVSSRHPGMSHEDGGRPAPPSGCRPVFVLCPVVGEGEFVRSILLLAKIIGFTRRCHCGEIWIMSRANQQRRNRPGMISQLDSPLTPWARWSGALEGKGVLDSRVVDGAKSAETLAGDMGERRVG